MTDDQPSPELEGLLDYLKRTRGFDFTAYKRWSLHRRIQKRMQTVGIRTFADYVDHLEVHPEEFPRLFNTILINVTAFFRDEDAWEALAAEIVPRILESKGVDRPIRIWSAGCASGEEAYTIAIVFAEQLGFEQFRDRVKIYATDIDEEALAQARLAIYPPKDVEGVPPAHLEKYFERTPTHYIFHKDLRRSVIFGRHDLTQNPPISRVDLLVCRNTLMYFKSESQGRILARFHFALNDGCYLFLGKAEMLLTHGHIFAPVDLKRRIFVKVPYDENRSRLLRSAVAGREGVALVSNDDETRLGTLAFEVDPVPQLLVDPAGVLTRANAEARALFGLAPGDVGRNFRDLTVSYRPVDLRTAIEEAAASRRPVVRRDVGWATPSGETRQFDIGVLPLLEPDGSAHGTKVVFTDVTRYQRLQSELQQSKQALETAYEELQSSNEELETTNEELQSSNEELETTNEELQSSNEELETTNEELQSTNEELETMNEELQSTNEELETINTELRMRTDELNSANGLLGSILGGLRGGVVVVDRDMKVLVWNERAADLWGVRAEEARGKHLLNLDIGLPVAQLREPIRKILGGESRLLEVTLDATSRRGKPVRCGLTCTPLESVSGSATGAILLMEVKDDLPA